MLLYIDVFLVRETVIVRPFQRNQDCYCDYFLLIGFNKVRFRLRLIHIIHFIDTRLQNIQLAQQ